MIASKAILKHLYDDFFAFFCCPTHTCRISIARDSLSRSLFSRLRGSLSPSLIAQLIPLGLLKAGAQKISIALIIHSVDRTLQITAENQNQQHDTAQND